MKISAKIAASVLMLAVALLGVVALTTTPASADCQPIACPAIAKLCPTGEIACRPSPCSCALACAPPGSPACN